MSRKCFLAPLLVVGLVACVDQGDDNAANVATGNTMNAAAEATSAEVAGPWGSLRNSVGQYPRDLDLFDRSVITDDLKALLGDKFDVLKANMEVQGPLQEDRLLYVIGNKAHQGGIDSAYLLIEPVTQRLEVGLWEGGEFTAYTSPGDPLYKPRDVRTLIENIQGQPPEQQESAENCREELNLSPGTTVERSGTISRYDYCEYRVRATEGQKITASLEGAPSLNVIVYGQASPELSNGEVFTVPADGIYPLRVLQPRAIAERDSEEKPFTLKIAIE